MWGVASAAVAIAIVAIAIVSKGFWKQSQEPRFAEVPPAMPLITQTQYINTLRYIFGSGIEYRVQFAPIQRVDGMVAVGASSAVMTNGAIDQFDAAARSIAAQVVDAKRRDFLVPCRPSAENGPDDKCASEFLSKTGRLLFRHSLASDKLKVYVAIARDSAVAARDFYAGLSTALASMLVAPQFLYVTPIVEQAGSERRLAPEARAARLSLLLWNAYPDDELLRAAESGALNKKKGLVKQVNRMLESPRLAEGVRAFFDDMLVFEDFDRLTKDGKSYPAFTNKVAQDAREQTLRTIIDHVVNENADYRDLFTTRKTFLTNDLGSIYGIPVDASGGWAPYEFPADSSRKGILTHASFVALHAHPGRSSPTLRGKALREVFLCQKVPTPPPNVDFSALDNPTSPFPTTRDRVNFHLKNAACAGCHKIMDPPGLALENFDGAGQYRDAEQGVAIDATGTLDGTPFKDVAGLTQAVHDNPQLPRCLIRRVTSYALGRPLGKDDKAWLDYADGRFSAGGYRVKELLRTIATSQALYAVPAQVNQ